MFDSFAGMTPAQVAVAIRERQAVRDAKSRIGRAALADLRGMDVSASSARALRRYTLHWMARESYRLPRATLPALRREADRSERFANAWPSGAHAWPCGRQDAHGDAMDEAGRHARALRAYLESVDRWREIVGA